MTTSPTWMADASCTTADPESLFPDTFGSTNLAAIRVCRGCPVAIDCLAYALARPDLDGIWGGYTSHDRDRMRQGKSKPCADCNGPVSTRYARCEDCRPKHAARIKRGQLERRRSVRRVA